MLSLEAAAQRPVVIHLGELQLLEREGTKLAQERLVAQATLPVARQKGSEPAFVQRSGGHCIIAPHAGQNPKVSRRRALLLAGIAALNILTLAALWTVAWRVREQKLAARLGTDSPGPETEHLPLHLGSATRFAYFTLLVAHDGTLQVLNARGAPCADFADLVSGDRRNWQELALAVLETDGGRRLVGARLEAGALCRSPGLYRKLREGLRIKLPGGRALIVRRWAPEEPALAVEIESEGAVRAETLRGPAEWTAAGLRIGLERDPSTGWALRGAEAR